MEHIYKYKNLKDINGGIGGYICEKNMRRK